MSKPKWYNWVGDPIWDEYCKWAWILIFGPFFAMVLLVLTLAIKTAVTG